MIVKVKYQRGDAPVDVEISFEPDSTAGEVAEQLLAGDPRNSAVATNGRASDGHTIAVIQGGRSTHLDAAARIVDSPVVSGCTIDVVAASEKRFVKAPAAEVVVEGGSLEGKRFPLRAGLNIIGRGLDADVRLFDGTVSKAHARVTIGDVVEIVDNSSSNGTFIGGVRVSRAVVSADDLILLGDTTIRIVMTARSHQNAADAGYRFVRSPRIDAEFSEEKLVPPEVPAVPEPARLSWAAMLAPLVLGAGLYAVNPEQPAGLLFMLMSPVMVVGQWVESRISRKRAITRTTQLFAEQLSLCGEQVGLRQEEERVTRCQENPSGEEVGRAIRTRSDLLWCRRPTSRGFMQVRLGLGAAESRVRLDAPTTGNRNEQLQAELRTFIESVASIGSVPIVADLTCSAVGVAGPRPASAQSVRSLMVQLAGLHAPTDLTIAAVMGSRSRDEWDWLKWLPHATSTGLLGCQTVAAGPGAGAVLVTAIEDELARRRTESGNRSTTADPHRILLLVEDDTPVERGRLVEIAELGPSLGVHVIWRADRVVDLPAACRVFVDLCAVTPSAGFVEESLLVRPLDPDTLSPQHAEGLGLELAPLVDSGSPQTDQSDLPSSVSFLGLTDMDLGRDPVAVLDRWRESDHKPGSKQPGGRQQAGTLRALVGQSAAGPLTLDLRSDGPHALVGGTTGSGKSELLQSWVVAMAATHSPQRVTFLFVDYKGGSAFGECVALPHSVGLVTDLSPHLVHRALQSLNAEVHHRERILNRARAKDLVEMEKSGHPDTPPSLVIVVDEFAALVHEVPEFVDGVVNIAQRGRSLGLHLILATQRPAGVIKDNLRANTNLRIALRMADADDSTDVLGDPMAASFDSTAPGRAAVRTGPGRITTFQSAYLGGYSDDSVPQRRITVTELSSTEPKTWPQPERATHGGQLTSDLQRVLATIQEAARRAGITPPRRPWLPELADVIDLWDLETPRTDTRLVFALRDEPETQSQSVCSFDPDIDGNLAIYGAGGAGKSTALRSLAVAAGFAVRGGPIHVYGLDFGARGLAMLEPLPHVGSIIQGDDTERVARLLRSLRQAITERSERYSAVSAATIDDYRSHANCPTEPRILLLLDGLAAFRQFHDVGSPGGLFESLTSIAADGRPVGIHLVLTADRPATVPSALNSLVSRRLVLRLGDENDLSMLNVPRDLFSIDSPPGRGHLDGHEIQVAVFGGDRTGQAQARAITRLARSLTKHQTWLPAPPVRRLPTDLRRSDLPDQINGLPVLGMVDETLEPVTFRPEGTFVIAGPPGSGRSTTLDSMLQAIRVADPHTRFALLCPGRRPTISFNSDLTACGADDVALAATDLAEQLRDSSTATKWCIAIEGAGEFVNGPADYGLQQLLRICREFDHFVIAEGETQSVGAYGALLQALRLSRCGIAMQPDQIDGETVFKTPFPPRIRRADFPLGRGLLVSQGRSHRVQVAWDGPQHA